ncbi:MAG: hypothetical protein MI922_00095 [Bacteroidales bacterium]|nr:hypothetical protein [Bacteroidales bacterium]
MHRNLSHHNRKSYWWIIKDLPLPSASGPASGELVKQEIKKIIGLVILTTNIIKRSSLSKLLLFYGPTFSYFLYC